MTSLIGALLNRAPVPFAPPYRVATPFGHHGSTASLKAMESVGTIFAIVNRTAEAASGVEWKLFRKRADGRRTYAYEGMDDRTEVTQHLALKVFNKPNRFFTRQELIEAYVQHMCLVGEAWWSLAYTDGFTAPMEIWPIRPDRMTVIEDAVDFISGYEYRSPDGRVIRLDPSSIIFSRRVDPLSSFRGVGPVQSVMAKADSVRYSDEWNLSYFLNSAEPGGIIKVGEELTDREIQRIQTRWMEAHKGSGNAHRVAILDGEELEWIPNTASQRDMQFTELQTLNSDKIREAFGFPKPMLGSVDDVNRANAEAAEVMFARWVLCPLLERIKAMLNTEFLPLFGTAGEGVEFDYVNPVPDDREADARDLEAKSKALKDLVDAGVFGPEALQAVGLPPMSFGDPSADADRQLLISLVTRAPLLAPTILPLLGFNLPQQGTPDQLPPGGDTDEQDSSEDAA